MKIEHLSKRALHLGDPDEKEQPIEQVAWRCVGYPSEFGGQVRPPEVVVWLPLSCPVQVGDFVWTQGYYALWTPADRSVEDVHYMRADRGWLFNGEPVAERREMASLGRA